MLAVYGEYNVIVGSEVLIGGYNAVVPRSIFFANDNVLIISLFATFYAGPLFFL
jgi:hypothetical protein